MRKRLVLTLMTFLLATVVSAEELTETIDRTFDVTDELRQIVASGADLEAIDVVFEVTTGRITPGSEEISFDPEDTRLTVGEIELRVTAADD